MHCLSGSRFRSTVLSLILTISVGCILPVAASAQQPAEPAADTAGALGMVTGYVAAWNLHDMNALAGLFAEDGNFINPFGRWSTGRDQVEAEHTERHKTIFQTSKMAADTSTIRFITPEIAVIHFQWTVTGHQAPVVASGKPLHGLTTIVVRKGDGRWVIESGQVTFISQAPAVTTQNSAPR